MANTETFYKQNRLRQFRAFCQTAQTGSISRAAKRLALSQPSVSLQIQALEKEFETQLFERHGPRIKLTDSGRILLEMAQPLVEGMERLSETFAARLGKLDEGALDIAAGETASLYLLPPVVKRYSDAHPRISLRLHNMSMRAGLDLLRSNEGDFAVGSLLEVPEDIEFHAFTRYQPVLITSINHPLAQREEVTPGDISPHGLIRPAWQSVTWRVAELVFQQHGVPYKVKLEAGGWEAIKEYVELGLGAAIVTGVCLKGDEPLATVPLSSAFPERSYGVAVRKGKFLSPHARAFLELMAPATFQREDANGIPRGKVPLPSTRMGSARAATPVGSS